MRLPGLMDSPIKNKNLQKRIKTNILTIRLLAKTLFFCCLSGLMWTSNVRAEVILQESFDYYLVSPTEGQSLRAAFVEASPISKDNKTRFGQTNWSIQPGYRARNFSSGCYISEANVQLNITITMPQLYIKGGAPEDMQKKFDFFYNALYQHELGHKSIVVKAADEIDELLSKKDIFFSCSELYSATNDQIKLIIQKYMDLNRDYDVETDYGRSQGAVVKEVIIVE